MCLKGKAASPVRGLAALLFMGTAALTGMDLLVRPHPLFDFCQYVWQVKQGVFMQRRLGDIARFVVKMVWRSGDTGIMRCIVPSQDRTITEKLVRIVPKGRLVVQPGLELVAPGQPTSHFQFLLTTRCLVVVDNAQRPNQGMST